MRKETKRSPCKDCDAMKQFKLTCAYFIMMISCNVFVSCLLSYLFQECANSERVKKSVKTELYLKTSSVSVV